MCANGLKAVIFDLGKVLIDYDWMPKVRELASQLSRDPNGLRKEIFKTDFFHDFERGTISPHIFHKTLVHKFGLDLGYESFVTVWTSIFTGEIQPIADVARAMIKSGNVQVAALSNTNLLHAEYLRNTWPLMRELPTLFLSHELGVRKPEKAVYSLVVNALGRRPEECIFVDDLIENVEAAQSLGMETLLVSDPVVAAQRLIDRLNFLHETSF